MQESRTSGAALRRTARASRAERMPKGSSNVHVGYLNTLYHLFRVVSGDFLTNVSLSVVVAISELVVP